MNLIEKATIAHYHRHRIGRYRAGAVESLGWRAVESQSRRFEAIGALADFSGHSILDLGCGYGDFRSYLDGRYTGFTYLGVDQMPEFIEEAKRRWADATGTDFVQSDFTRAQLPESDLVVASGALIYRCATPGFHHEMIARFFKAARIGFAFNMLDAALFPPHDLLVGHNRTAVTAFCRGLCSSVKIVDGYLPDDFTVLMTRHSAQGET